MAILPGAELALASLRHSACVATLVVGCRFHTNRVPPFAAWAFVRSVSDH